MYWRRPPGLRPIQAPVWQIATVLGSGVACVIGLVLGCTAVVTNPIPHAAVLDRLSIPASWTLADTNVVKSALLGSRIERYYFVDADPRQLVEPVNQMLVAAAFSLEVRNYPSDWCTYTKVGDTGPPSGSFGSVCPTLPLEPCSTNGLGGPTTCYLGATAGGDRIAIDNFDRGEGINYFIGSESHSVRAPGLVTVRVTDNY